MTKEEKHLIKVFVSNETLGEEKRSKLFEDISWLILALIEKAKVLDISVIEFQELVTHYMNMASFFAKNQQDLEIFSYFVWAQSSKENFVAEVFRGKGEWDVLDLYAMFDEDTLFTYRKLAQGILGL